jgi:hypothetical protein
MKNGNLSIVVLESECIGELLIIFAIWRDMRKYINKSLKILKGGAQKRYIEGQTIQ